MSEVKKWYIGAYGGEAQARPCSPAEFEIIRASEGRYFVLAENYDSAVQCFLTAAEGCVAAERREQALQQLLTAADERVDVLEGLLLQTNELLYAIQGDPGAVPSSSIDAMRGEVFTALKPVEAAPAATCTWSESGFSWNTGCGKEWQFTDGGLPAENGMRFCHSCGKTLVAESAETP